MSKLLSLIDKKLLAGNYIVATIALHFATMGDQRKMQTCLKQAETEWSKMSEKEKDDMLRPLILQ